MTKNVQTRIVEENSIFCNYASMNIKFTEAFLHNLCSSQTEQLQFLARLELIKNFSSCTKCDVASTELMSLHKRVNVVDGFAWVCLKCRCKQTVRKGSFFEKSKKPFSTHLMGMYKYVCGHSFVDISWELGINRATSSEYAETIRTIICDHLIRTASKLGGLREDGSSIIVEIDESLFFKRKYYRGRLRNRQWYVGGIERGSRKVFIVPVENRDADTMFQLIKQNVKPGTTIITDKWAAYKKAMKDLPGYSHETINHSLNFVDNDNPEIHTQNIEGLWSRSKFFLRKKHGMKQNMHSELLI